MPDNHYSVAALPTSGAPNKALLRAGLVSRNAYCLRDDEDSQDLIAIDPDGGGTVPAILQFGRLYSHDPDDSTTAHDGVICLVSNDSQRYKLDDLKIPYNVLDKDLTAPPVSPSIGDTYLIYGSPTGAWAGHAGAITRYTSRGWEFATAPIGFLVYAEDEEGYYHRDSNGDWQQGVGARTLGTNSVTLANAINFGRRLIVENQTTNTPPGSPTAGDAYIIGSSPTGAWAGNAGKIAIFEGGSSFAIYTPGNGWLAFDKALNGEYRYSGTAWVTAAGSIIGYKRAFNAASLTTNNVSASGYTYSATVAPTTAAIRAEDTATITYTAKNATNILEFTYQFVGVATLVSADFTIGILRANSGGTYETNAVDWLLWVSQASANTQGQVTFSFVAGDTNEHIYKMVIFRSSGGESIGSVNRRTFTLKEIIPS